jgi:hypothetical protein
LNETLTEAVVDMPLETIQLAAMDVKVHPNGTQEGSGGRPENPANPYFLVHKKFPVFFL